MGFRNGTKGGFHRTRHRGLLWQLLAWGRIMQTEWRKLRADELREQAREDAIVILPVASLEQHGPHLPVEVDSMLGETVAARTAGKVLAGGQKVLVLPVLWTGLSEHHMSFGGTVTLDNATFALADRGRGAVGPASWVSPDRAAQRAWGERECAAHHCRRSDAEAWACRSCSSPIGMPRPWRSRKFWRLRAACSTPARRRRR